jgi:hypothetical protein
VASVRPRTRTERRAVSGWLVSAAAVVGLLAGGACANPMALEHTTSSGNHSTSSGNLDQGGLEVE